MYRREKMILDIYRVIWYLLQFIFDVVDICCRLGTLFKAKWKSIERRFGGEDFTSEKLLIERNKKILTKIPLHLAVILGTELPDFRALSKIIFWCLSAGIQNISFYDHQGNRHCPYPFLIAFFSNNFSFLCRYFGHG